MYAGGALSIGEQIDDKEPPVLEKSKKFSRNVEDLCNINCMFYVTCYILTNRRWTS